MIEKNNEYIGYIIKENKVIFKANNSVYIKKIKEKNKARRYNYTISESVNITCKDLNNDYVIINSDNQPYFNKTLLTLNIIAFFITILTDILMLSHNSKLIILPISNTLTPILLYSSIILTILLFILSMFQLFYVIFKQPKKIYKKFTQTIYGEIIDFSRTEYRHDKDETFHCDYNIMYKYKTPSGQIIHSVVNGYPAHLLYKDYPLNQQILIRYNPSKCCESCLADEYNSMFSKTKFVKRGAFLIQIIGTITNIKTKCFDEEIDEYIKEHCYIDYIECEYSIANTTYKTYSIFAVPHGRFKIGEQIRIFCENDDKTKFFCDINKRYSNLDKY